MESLNPKTQCFLLNIVTNEPNKQYVNIFLDIILIQFGLILLDILFSKPNRADIIENYKKLK